MKKTIEDYVENLFRIVDGDIGMDGGFLNDNGTKASIRGTLESYGTQREREALMWALAWEDSKPLGIWGAIKARLAQLGTTE